MAGASGRRQGASNSDPNGPEAAVDAFLKALASKDKENLTKMIASKAAGELARILKGDIDDRGLSKLADTYSKLNIIRVNPGKRGDERVVVLGTGQSGDTSKNKKVAGLKQLVLRKEDGAWKVFQLP